MNQIEQLLTDSTFDCIVQQVQIRGAADDSVAVLIVMNHIENSFNRFLLGGHRAATTLNNLAQHRTARNDTRSDVEHPTLEEQVAAGQRE